MSKFDLEQNLETAKEVVLPYECEVKGKIPPWLNVTLLRNGPGRFKFGKSEMNHWFDGMAFLQQFHFKDSKMFFSAKFLQSDAYKRSCASDRLVLSAFGTNSFPDPCKNIFSRYFTEILAEDEISDNALVNFMECGDSLYAVTERPILVEIDKDSLNTIASENLSDYIALHICTAHQHYDPEGNVLNVGMRFGKNPKFVFVQTENPGKGNKVEKPLKNSKLLKQVMVDDPNNPAYIHSFGMTENYLVVFETPLRISLRKLMFRRFTGHTFRGCMDWRKNLGYTRVHVFNWKTGEAVEVNYKANPFSTFHHANAYEKDGFLFVDYCGYDYIDLTDLNVKEMRKRGTAMLKDANGNPSKAYLRRMIIPLEIPHDAKIGEDLLKRSSAPHATACSAVLESAEIEKQAVVRLHDEKLCDISFEFPRYNYSFNARQYQFVYGSSFVYSPEDTIGLTKADVNNKTSKVWRLDNEEQYSTEPVFVARPGGVEEDDGGKFLQHLS